MNENIMNSPFEYKIGGLRLLKRNYYDRVAKITSRVVTNDTYRKYKNFVDKNPAARMIVGMAKRKGVMLTVGGIIGLATGAGFALAHVDSAYAAEIDGASMAPNPDDVTAANNLENVTVTQVAATDVSNVLESNQNEVPAATEPVVDATEPTMESTEPTVGTEPSTGDANENTQDSNNVSESVADNKTTDGEEVTNSTADDSKTTDDKTNSDQGTANLPGDDSKTSGEKTNSGQEAAALSTDNSNTVDGVNVDGKVDGVEDGTPADQPSDEKDDQNNNEQNGTSDNNEDKNVIDMSQLGDEKGFDVKEGEEAEWVYTPPTTEGNTTSIVIYTPDGQAYVVSTPYAGLSETSKEQLFQGLFDEGKIPYNPKDSSTWPAEWIENGINPKIQYILGFKDGENHVDSLAGGFDVVRDADGKLTFKSDGSTAFHVVNTAEGFELDQSQRPDSNTIPDDGANKGDKKPEPNPEPKPEPNPEPNEPNEPNESEESTPVPQQEGAMPQTGDSNLMLAAALGALATGGAGAMLYAKRKMRQGQTSNLYDGVAFQTVDNALFVNGSEAVVNTTALSSGRTKRR